VSSLAASADDRYGPAGSERELEDAHVGPASQSYLAERFTRTNE
jgi:hypothetical protein